VTSASTILPLETVNVQAVKSTYGNGTDLNSTISWNFGDPSSSYNSNLIGFNAAHAYASAGTYTITCTITTPDGHVGIATTTVTVAADTRKTIYVSANGSDSNNGSSASQAIQSIARLNQLITSNTRVLFQDGATYSMKSGIDLAGLQHVYIGTYGSGAAPILMATGGNVGSLIGLSSSSEGIVVQGLTFDSTSTSDDGTAPDACDVAGNGIAFISNTFYHLEDDFNLNQNPTNVLIQGNSSPSTADLYGYFSWTQGQNVAIIGNTVANSIDQALVRADATGTENINISYNNLTKTTPASQTYKNCITDMWVTNSTIYMNTLTNGPMQTGPLDPGVDGSTPTSATCSNVIAESNVFNNSKLIISANTQGMEFANNVIHSPDTNAIWIAGSGEYSDVKWVSSNLNFDHNTVQSTDGDGSGFIVLFGGGSLGDISVTDNVYDAPNVGYGDYNNAFIYAGSMGVSMFTDVSGNVLYNGSNAGSAADYVGSSWVGQSSFDSSHGLGTNTVEAVNFDSTWQIGNAGSNLPLAA
jgi:PKD domain